MAESNRPLKVFLCHGSADKAAVHKLYHRLVADGVDPWLDVENLLPGQNWREEIPNAVRESDVVLVCLSKSSINKEGYVQKEIKFALDKAEEIPEGRIFLIPTRLEECKVPNRLSNYQWVDLFQGNGYNRLMSSLRVRAKEIEASVPGRNNLSSSSGGMKIKGDETEKKDLQPKTLVQLGESTYFVQKVINSRISGPMIIRSAHASDQVMQEDVGILHISFATNQGNAEKQILRASRKAQNMNKAANHTTHLPVIKNIISQEQELWVISQWIRGRSLSQYYPLDGPLPNVADIVQILGWAIDICDGLAALHEFRELHGGLIEDSIIIKRGRGAILIDPAFAGGSNIWELSPAPFDPHVDIAALGNLLYRSLTHQTASRETESHFNFHIPADLEAIILEMQEGSIGKALDLKRALIQIRKKARHELR